MKWHHENVVVACLSADEVHKPSGDPQDKPHPLKIILNTRRKYQEPFWKSPENLDSTEKFNFAELLDFFTKNTMQKESIHLDLWLKSFGCLKLSRKIWNLD